MPTRSRSVTRRSSGCNGWLMNGWNILPERQLSACGAARAVRSLPLKGQGNRIWRDAGGELPPPSPSKTGVNALLRGRVGVGVALCNSTHLGRVHAVSPRTRTPSTPEQLEIVSVQSVGKLPGLYPWLTPTPTLPLSGGGSAPPEVLHMRLPCPKGGGLPAVAKAMAGLHARPPKRSEGGLGWGSVCARDRLPSGEPHPASHRKLQPA